MVSLDFFIDINLPVALWPWGSTQPLTEMSTRNITGKGRGGGKGGRCVGLTTLPPSCASTSSNPHDEVTGEWRKLHNEEPHDLYSPNIVRVIKSIRTRSAEYVARKGRREACTVFWRGNLRKLDHWGDPRVNGRITLVNVVMNLRVQ
jgi:hypothetical protein